MLWMHKKYSEDSDNSVAAATAWHHSRTSFLHTLKSWILQCISWDHCRGLTPALHHVFLLVVKDMFLTSTALRRSSYWHPGPYGFIWWVLYWMSPLPTTLKKVKCKPEDSELRWGNQSQGQHQYTEPKRAFSWDWQKLSSASYGLLSNQPWAMKKPKKESPESKLVLTPF